MSGDRITLTLPRERDFFRVAHLVVGGLAVRLDLTFENLEDLQVALATVLRESRVARTCLRRRGRCCVRVAVEHDARASIGPFAARASTRSRPRVEDGGPALTRAETVVRLRRPSPSGRRPMGSAEEEQTSGEGKRRADGREERQGAAPPLPRARRPGGPRAADRAVHVARPLARAPLLVPRRAARGSRPDRRDRADQGDRPLRPRPRRRADDLRDAEHHRRDQAPLPRQGLVGARPARPAGAERPALAPRRAADGPARALADDPRARQGRGRRGGGSARGARVGPRVQLARSRPAAAPTRTASSTRSSRSAPRSTSTRSPRTARCSRRASACSTSGSGRSCTCASSRA